MPAKGKQKATVATNAKDMVTSSHKLPLVVHASKVEIALSMRRSEVVSKLAKKQGHRHAHDIRKVKPLAHRFVASGAQESESMPDEQEGDAMQQEL